LPPSRLLANAQSNSQGQRLLTLMIAACPLTLTTHFTFYNFLKNSSNNKMGMDSKFKLTQQCVFFAAHMLRIFGCSTYNVGPDHHNFRGERRPRSARPTNFFSLRAGAIHQISTDISITILPVHVTVEPSPRNQVTLAGACLFQCTKLRARIVSNNMKPQCLASRDYLPLGMHYV
jgi:hypothetical protein